MLSVAQLCAAAVSCELDETADIRLVELGTPLEDNVCIVEAGGGEYELEVYSNGAYHVEVLTENDCSRSARCRETVTASSD